MFILYLPPRVVKQEYKFLSVPEFELEANRNKYLLTVPKFKLGIESIMYTFNG